MKVGFVSLGCSKNLVDTEMMIGLFKKNNFEIVNNPQQADIIVINTCGFIEPAKEEAINTILEMAEYKNQNCKYLIVTGCLAERYKEDLIKELPEVDLFVKFSEYDTIWEQIEQLINNNIKLKKTKSIENEEKNSTENKKEEKITIDNHINQNEKLDFLNRVISTGENFAYIRIAEGCNNFCTFCAIPYIRGRFTSRKIEDILEEAKQLAQKGYKELIIIAQDTSKYGVDIYGKPMLDKLLHKISEIDGIEWIRFLYTYPETITDELIQEVKNNDKICKYFDIPMQHISDRILKKMNRKSTGESIRNLITKLRKEIPGVVIRSTLMVGFPGETEEDFEELYEFVKWAKLDKLGCFTYSKEEGTAAFKMENQVHPMTKKKRYNKIMALQQEISKENMKKHIGKTLKVLVENYTAGNEYINVQKNSEKNSNINKFNYDCIGRTYMDVPDIDGVIYIKGKAKPNTFVNCKVKDFKEYDLMGEIL